MLTMLAIPLWISAALLGLAGRAWEKAHLITGLSASLAASLASLCVLGGMSGHPIIFQFWGHPVHLEMDALSAAFMLPLQIVAGLGCLYATSYWPLSIKTGRYARFFFSLLTAGLSLVFIARQGMVFIIAWELMATSAFFLVGTEHEKPETRRASWVYLVCTHTGTLLLIASVILLSQRLGSFLWPMHTLTVPTLSDGGILFLAITAFCFKAGAFPLHFWLPDAHANSPSHVSALLSALMLKAGIYGILRMASILPPLPYAGSLLTILGAFTALFGVACALAQQDYKRLLAYSSIENIGIILMGIGLGWIGRHTQNTCLIAAGFGGAIFHVWNHSLFKSLLFFGAGSVLHATGTRNMEALGGLSRHMPRTTLLMLPGILAVSALPPFNGFVSEWILYRGFFAAFSHDNAWLGALAIFAIALTGGLAAVAFTKFFAFIFLGNPKSEAVSLAHDPKLSMILPMAVLAFLCLFMSLGALFCLPILDRIVQTLDPKTASFLARELHWDLSILSRLSGVLMLLGFGLWHWERKGDAQAGAPLPTWDCGYSAPDRRMQYTAHSFSDGWASLLPTVKSRARRIKAIFPLAAAFHSGFSDMVGDRIVPGRMQDAVQRLQSYRRLQQGNLSIYLLYIFITLLTVLLWMLIRPWVLG